MARNAHASLYTAFDACRQVLMAEGRSLNMASLKRLVREKFPDVLEEHSSLINDAGITVILRQVMKRHAGATEVSSQQIAMTLRYP